MYKRLLSLSLALCMMLTLLQGTAQAAEIASGLCGDNLTWVLDSTGTFTVSGTDDMSEYSSYSEVPWSDYVSVKIPPALPECRGNEKI